MFGIREYLEACLYRKNFLEQQRGWLFQERQQYKSDAQRLQSALDRVRQEMAGYLIPEINDEHLSELERHLECEGLLDIKKDYEQRFDAADRRRVQLESMDEIQNYDERIGAAESLVAELLPSHNELRSEFMHWSGSKWYAQLDRRGYFEEGYWPGFFNRFWDWRAVSFLMADLEGGAQLNFETPDQLKRHYRKLQEKYKVVIPEYDDRVAQRDRIAALKTEHQQCVSAPERLLGELYSDLGAAVLEHLGSIPQARKEYLASIDSNLDDFMKKEIGIRKQIQYLEVLAVSRIDSQTQNLDLETAKIDGKINKLEMKRRRGKQKFYSQDDIDRMRAVKTEKWAKRRLKTEKIRRKITDFNKYDRGSVTDDFLRWDLITNSSYGDDIYEVREHRQRFPNWNHRQHRDSWHTDDDDDYANALIDDAAGDLSSSMADNDSDLFDPS